MIRPFFQEVVWALSLMIRLTQRVRGLPQSQLGFWAGVGLKVRHEMDFFLIVGLRSTSARAPIKLKWLGIVRQFFNDARCPSHARMIMIIYLGIFVLIKIIRARVKNSKKNNRLTLSKCYHARMTRRAPSLHNHRFQKRLAVAG